MATTRQPVGKRAAPIELLTSTNLARLPWLVHGFSTRKPGFSRSYGGCTLNLGFTRDDAPTAVERNRAAFLKAVTGNDSRRRYRLVTLRQIHSDVIHFVDSPPPAPLAGDGLLTSTPGLLLTVLTADCLPVMLVDTRQRAAGLVHAGWRGTLSRIAQKGVGEMQRRFGSQPAHILAAIGPGIHRCCYQVGPEVRQKFESRFTYGSELFQESKESDPVREKYPLLFLTARAPGHSDLPVRLFLDLVEANRRQLIEAGVPEKNLEASPLCTSCRPDLLFSHRADKGLTGRMMAALGIAV